jgi:hypothetical protein
MADNKLKTYQADSDHIDEPFKETVAKVSRMAGDPAKDLAKWGAAREKVECL